ncbi:hypothetical protein [Algoriphagus sp. CAU 1675]|uniref:hypothetical protein n=1 Tax=Algoriphagus sp. CAU 1675 TaxID=3032597 RepID=UPI0023DCA266|nr:hypothetical protein [Algoriphagus sp. CAU 1675]MDF2158794.1 hypothetical protein [Algoriphagus sp. CAU 1675]
MAYSYGLWIPETYFYQMHFLKEFYLRLTWLSIDVVLGAMGGMLFFSKLLRVDLVWEIYALLGLTVWSIYTADHLLDSRRKAEFDLSPRHQFHARNQTLLVFALAIVVLLGLAGAYFVFGLGAELSWSLVLGVLIAGSMGLIRLAGNAVNGLKEISTALFYCLGIAWIPILRADPLDMNWIFWAFFAGFSGLAFLNLLMLSFLDRKQDLALGFSSAARLFSEVGLLNLIRRMAFLLIFLGLFGFIFLPSLYKFQACLLLIMCLIHYLSFFNSKLTADEVRMRTEAAFMLPWFLVLL